MKTIHIARRLSSRAGEPTLVQRNVTRYRRFDMTQHTMLHRLCALTAAPVVALGIALAPATARADTGGPSCVGQLASALAGPQYGLLVSSFAHDVHPFGSAVSFNATSPKDACPFGP